jgi:hypothetical protein
MTYGNDQALILIPYEYLPLPEVGTIVNALDREGKVAGSAEVLKVLMPRAYDHTAVVSIVVPRRMANVVRMISIPKGTEGWTSR